MMGSKKNFWKESFVYDLYALQRLPHYFPKEDKEWTSIMKALQPLRKKIEKYLDGRGYLLEKKKEKNG